MNFERPSDLMFANRLQLVFMFVTQRDTGIPIMLSYTQTSLRIYILAYRYFLGKPKVEIRSVIGS